MKTPQLYSIAVVLLLASACSGPLGPFPGGSLEGDPMPYPENWHVAEATDHVQLETYNTDGHAHSVNIWCVVHDENMYFTTSLVRGEEIPENRQWVQNALTHNEARVRVGDVIYEGTLERVLDAELVAGIKNGFVLKYDIEVDERTGNAWIFEFAKKQT